MTYPPDFIADALRPLCWTRVKWEVLEAPHEAQYEPGHTFETQSIGFVPRDGDIGLWRFGCTAIDNEKEKDFEKISVQVRNLPPEIDLVDEAIQVETGETVQVETKIVDDPDNGEGGGGLTFQWDIIQAPLGANTGVMRAYSTQPILNMPTGPDDVGTFVFRLTVPTMSRSPGRRASRRISRCSLTQLPKPSSRASPSSARSPAPYPERCRLA